MLTNSCNEKCAFCYADDFFKAETIAGPGELHEITSALDHYARLVADAPPLPAWDAEVDELTATYRASRVVNLMGGEPTLHPYFADVVEHVHGHGLGVIMFTNGSTPQVVDRVKDKLWSITMNGLFAFRAPDLPFDRNRIFVNLPVRPTDDIIKRLTVVRDAGIKGIFLAFATPAGGSRAKFFTPNDLAAMQRFNTLAKEFCAENGIHLGYDCSFPLCVDEAVAQTRCTSVPVMDSKGFMSICGGEYFSTKEPRHVTEFDSLEELHTWTFGLIEKMRALPSQFDVCNNCPHFNVDCHGMCLVFRESESTAPQPKPATTDFPEAERTIHGAK